MAKGESGRIVIEINPELKRHLYSVLAMESQTLKDWFIKAASEYVNAQEKPASPAARDATSRRKEP